MLLLPVGGTTCTILGVRSLLQNDMVILLLHSSRAVHPASSTVPQHYNIIWRRCCKSNRSLVGLSCSWCSLSETGCLIKEAGVGKDTVKAIGNVRLGGKQCISVEVVYEFEFFFCWLTFLVLWELGLLLWMVVDPQGCPSQTTSCCFILDGLQR